jgi:hypothetical protein
MKILMILFVFYALWSNVNGWKGLFKSREKLQKEFTSAIEEGKKASRKHYQLVFLIVLTTLTTLNILFFAITGTILSHQTIFLIWSVLVIVGYIKGFFKSVNMLSTGIVPKISFLSRLCIPINTVYILYFAYQYLFVIGQ